MDESERRQERETERGGEKGMSRGMRPTMACGKINAILGMVANERGGMEKYSTKGRSMHR